MYCKNCQQEFEITSADKEFYKKMKVPAPTNCPACREKRRLAWRNEWKLYKNKCGLCKQNIISYIAPDSKYKVYCMDCFFSDKWDARDYGRDFDFNRPFFEQFDELMRKTPQIPLLIGDSENSKYTNYSWGNKGCYMISAADFNEDSFYSGYIFRSRDCMDCLFVSDSELCYECADCEKCYDISYCQYCKDCAESMYLFECVGCKHCFGCVNLVREEYCILNKKYSKEEYEEKKREIAGNLPQFEKEYLKLKEEEPHKNLNLTHCENCEGSNLVNCKKCFNCYDLIDSEDCKYVNYGMKAKDCMDMNGAPETELCYECLADPQCYNTRFTAQSWIKSRDLTYCNLCRACRDCFGCVSLHMNKYCILNKQYSEEEYAALIPKIIDHMTETSEWGEFFPLGTAPFKYEDTVANLCYPR